MARTAPRPRDTESHSELGALTEFPFEVGAEFINVIEGMHHGIAGRAFKRVGLMGMPARFVHDAVSRAAYAGVRGTGRLAGRAAARAVTRTAPSAARDLSRQPMGSMLVAALNGVVGDRFDSEGNAMSIAMAVRMRGHDVSLDRGSIRRAFPRAQRRIAVFVHGLCGEEHCWEFFSARHYRKRHVSYGSQLSDEFGYTPVYVRYNTGLHISRNGRELARLLERLTKNWPVDVDEVALFGHSMGGLVVRSACHYGAQERLAWTRDVRHVFCLGSPHLGAPLEKAASMGTFALSMLPETRPFATFLNQRSVGIKDLRFGSIVDEDWLGRDLDAYLRDASTEIPFLENATYYFVAATLSGSPEHPLSWAIGDLLVRFPSASGRGGRRTLSFKPEHGRHFGRLNHFSLLNHPAVYAVIREWLKKPPPAGVAVGLEVAATGEGEVAAETLEPAVVTEAPA